DAGSARARARAARPGRPALRLAARQPMSATPAPLYLVDASLYVFRAWHSVPAGEFRDADGFPANAVHRFARSLLEPLQRERPLHIAIAFDEALDSCFRSEERRVGK